MVTAAHCHTTNKRKQFNLLRLGEYEVTDKIGRDCSGDFCLEKPQDFDIKSEDFIIHPEYGIVYKGGVYQGKRRNIINDIALIRLPRTARENAAVRVACLPLDPNVAAAQLNVPDLGEGLASFYATVVGWGQREGYDPYSTKILHGSIEKVASPIQQKAAMTVLSKDQCSEKFGGFTFISSQICAGGEEVKDTCKVSSPN